MELECNYPEFSRLPYGTLDLIPFQPIKMTAILLLLKPYLNSLNFINVLNQTKHLRIMLVSAKALCSHTELPETLAL